MFMIKLTSGSLISLGNLCLQVWKRHWSRFWGRMILQMRLECYSCPNMDNPQLFFCDSCHNHDLTMTCLISFPQDPRYHEGKVTWSLSFAFPQHSLHPVNICKFKKAPLPRGLLGDWISWFQTECAHNNFRTFANLVSTEGLAKHLGCCLSTSQPLYFSLPWPWELELISSLLFIQST
jgi:hypothetical protein